VVYLDFSKAFESVVHAKLIAKLKCYGICDVLLCWIESFLANRRQVKSSQVKSFIRQIILQTDHNTSDTYGRLPEKPKLI
jgi:hypothetical protein